MNDVVQVESSPGVLASLERSGWETQIEVAKRFPRNIKAFRAEAEALVTENAEVAASMYYCLERRGDHGPVKIYGPSVRLAEIVQTCYGNLRTMGRCVEENEKFAVCEGICVDLQRNTAVSSSVRVNLTRRDGRRYNDDMVTNAINAGISKAIRNAIFRVVPRVYIEEIVTKARQVAAGDAKTFAETRQRVLAAFQALGVDETRVCRACGRQSPLELTMDDVADLRSKFISIREGEMSIEEAFPEPEPEHASPAPAAQAFRQAMLRRGKEKRAESDEKPDPEHVPPPPTE